MSWDDICHNYPDEWVLIARPNDARRADVLGGWVLAHSPDEAEVVLAMDLTPIFYDLALVHTDRELAATVAGTISTIEYLTWRPIFVDERTAEEVALSEQPPPPRPKRWWQFWR